MPSYLPPAASADHEDEVIGLRIANAAQAVAVEQSALYELNITNNGPAAASFDVRVVGLPPQWVTVTPSQVRLGKKKSATVTLTVTPPRLPASRAGIYHAAAIVTSPDHPGRSAQVSFTLAVQPARQPRSLLRLLLAAPLLLIAALLFWFLLARPRVAEFTALPAVVRAGEPVTLHWRTNPLASDLSIDGLTAPISGWFGQAVDFPTPPARTYRLRVSNGLARLLSPRLAAEAEQTVLVIPQTPVIRSFVVSGQGSVVAGDPVIVSWAVDGADEVWLWVGQTAILIPPGEHIGYHSLVVRQNTVLAIEARSAGGVALQSALLRVTGEGGPVDQRPVIEFFTASPVELTGSGTVQLAWSVLGETTAIQIDSDVFSASDLLPRDSLTVQIDRSVVLVLTAFNGSLSASQAVAITVVGTTPPSGSPVIPTATPRSRPPTPTPRPTATPTAEPEEEATATPTATPTETPTSTPTITSPLPTPTP